jgi:hypothetical protein
VYWGAGLWAQPADAGGDPADARGALKKTIVDAGVPATVFFARSPSEGVE